MAKNKQRLDVRLHELGLAPSRSKAQALIMAGEVLVDGERVDKSGTQVALDAAITIKDQPRYVSRGGEKLEGALLDFSFDVSHLICADVGSSTGGFTDCLLQHGAAKVYAIDVGYGLLAHKLRIDERVVIMERTNARYIEALDEQIDLAVIDASFISLQILLPGVKKWLQPRADVIALIKPQFEAGKDDVGKRGVVRDKDIHERVIREIIAFSLELDFDFEGLTVSPIKGLKEGNTEFLVHLSYGQDAKRALVFDDELKRILAIAHDAS